MAITATSLTSGSSGTDTTSYATASVTPSANKLLLLAVEVARNSATATPSTWTVTGNGLTWVEVAKVGIDWNGSAYQGQLNLYRAMGAAPSAGAVTINLGAVTATSCAWSLVQCDGMDTSGTNGSGAIVQSATNTANAATTLTATLAAFASTNNATYACFGASDSAGTPRTYTPGSGFTEIHDTGIQYSSVTSMFRNTNDTTADTTTSASTNVAGIAVELKASGYSMAAAVGSMSITGNVVGLGGHPVMPADVGTMTITGNAAALNTGQTITLAITSSSTPAQIRTAFTNAVTTLSGVGGGRIIVPPGTYDMGTYSVDGAVICYSGSNLNNISIEGPGVYFTCTTVQPNPSVPVTIMPVFFWFTNCSNMRLTGFDFKDFGSDVTSNGGIWWGACAVSFDTSVAKGGFYFNCTAHNMLTLFRSIQSGQYTVSGLDINGAAYDTYYGVNANYSGSATPPRNKCNITCVNVRRAFISYGCKHWDITINGSNTNTSFPGSNGYCSIVPLAPGNELDDLNITINYTGYNICSKFIHFYGQGNELDATYIKNINATVNLNNVSGIAAAVFYFDHEKAGPTFPATTSREWSNVNLNGSVIGAFPASWSMVYARCTSTNPNTLVKVKPGIASYVAWGTANVPANIVPDTGLVATASAMTLTGNAAGLTKATRMTADSAAFVLTGNQANMPEPAVDWASVVNYGTAHDKALGNTLTVFSPGSTALTPGDVIIVAIGSDNIQTVDGPSTLVNSVIGNWSGTFEKGYEYTNGEASAGAGITCSVWYKRVNAFIPAGDDQIDISFASNVTAKVATAYIFHTSRAAVTIAAAAGQAVDGHPTTMTFSGLGSRQYLFFRAAATETGSYSFTPTAGYTALGTDATLVPGDLNDVSIGAEFRILTGTGDTSDPDTVNVQTASVFLAITTANQMTMTADTATFALSGVAAALPSNWQLPTATATFAVTGNAANVVRGQVMAADASGLLLTFNDNIVQRGRLLSATPAAMNVTGLQASMVGAWRMPADSAAVALSGIAAILGAGGQLTAAVGAFTLGSNPASFFHLWRTDAPWVGYEIGASDALFSLQKSFVMAADRGRFLSFNPDVALLYSADNVTTSPPVILEQGYRYAPEAPPSNASVSEALAWVLQELERASNVINNLADGKTITLHAAPDKLVDGMIRKADGTDWNPGAGAGTYVYDGGTAAWIKLG